jgi:hypothetical protein
MQQTEEDAEGLGKRKRRTNEALEQCAGRNPAIDSLRSYRSWINRWLGNLTFCRISTPANMASDGAWTSNPLGQNYFAKKLGLFRRFCHSAELYPSLFSLYAKNFLQPLPIREKPGLYVVKLEVPSATTVIKPTINNLAFLRMLLSASCNFSPI